MTCKKCGDIAEVMLSWAIQGNPQKGEFCRACAKEMNPLLSRYGLTVSPITDTKVGAK